MSRLVMIQVCKACGKSYHTFERRAAGQEYCPVCNDRRTRRPSVLVDRQTLATFPAALIGSLPNGGQWERFQARRKDTPDYKIDAVVGEPGDSWEGRLVLRARTPIRVGDVCFVRHMQSTHEVLVAAWSQMTSGFSDAPPVIERRRVLPATWDETRVLAAAVAGEFGRSAKEAAAEGRLTVTHETEEHEYVVLVSSAGIEPVYRMEWIERVHKHTLKGLGAQYDVTADLSAAVWQQSVSAGTRNRRRRQTGTLAILPVDEDVIIESRGHTGSGDQEPYTWRKPLPATPSLE